MLSLKGVIIFACLLSVALCDDRKKGVHHGHHHHLYFREFYYLLFLAVKFKIILVIGSIWAFGLVLAKIVAFFKISEYMKSKSHHDEHVVYVNPHDSYHHSVDYGKNFVGESYPADISFDGSPPSGAEVQPQAEYGPPSDAYGRSVKKDTSWVYKYFNLFSNFIKKYDITELVFKEMKITSEACKRKFVCEADYVAHHNSLIKSAFGLLSDTNYQRYKTNNLARSIEECATLNPTCIGKT